MYGELLVALVAGLIIGFAIKSIMGKKKIGSLNNVITNYVAESATQRSEYNELVQVNKNQKITIGDKTDQISSLTSDVNALKEQHTTCSEALIKANKKIGVVEGNYATLKEESVKANKASLAIANTNKTLRTANASLTNKVEKLEKDAKPVEKKKPAVVASVEKKKPVVKKKPTTATTPVEKKTTGSVGDNQKKLDCPKIKAARKRHDNGKGESLSTLASELNVAESTLKRAIDSVTYKSCKEDEKVTKPAETKPVVKKVVKPVVKAAPVEPKPVESKPTEKKKPVVKKRIAKKAAKKQL